MSFGVHRFDGCLRGYAWRPGCPGVKRTDRSGRRQSGFRDQRLPPSRSSPAGLRRRRGAGGYEQLPPGIHSNLQPVKIDRRGGRSQITRSPGFMPPAASSGGGGVSSAQRPGGGVPSCHVSDGNFPSRAALWGCRQTESGLPFRDEPGRSDPDPVYKSGLSTEGRWAKRSTGKYCESAVLRAGGRYPYTKDADG